MTAEELTALLDDWFTSHRGSALALARRILGDQSLAEDAVQQALVQLAMHARGGDAAGVAAHPRAALMRGTRWAALKLVRRRRVRGASEALAAEACDDAGAWDRAEAASLLSQILPQLPEHYRDVLRMRYFDDLPDAAGAEALRLSVKAYRRRLDRALIQARRVADQLGISVQRAAFPALTVRPRLRSWSVAADARLRELRSRLESISPGVAQGMTNLALGAAVMTMSVGQVASVAAPASPSLAAVAAHDPRAGVGTAGASSSDPRVARALSVAAAQAPAASRPGGAQPTPFAQPTLGSSVNPLFGQSSPEEVSFGHIAASPRWDTGHALVASAVAFSCDCFVGEASFDGGATWTSFPLPQQSNGEPDIVLPPAYPDDPRVLLSYPPPRSGVDCVLAHVGSTTCDPLPFTGRLQVDAAFDDGFPVVYGEAPDLGVAAYHLTSHAVYVLSMSPTAPETFIAAPTAIVPTAVYIQTLPTGATTAQLLACDRTFQCEAHNRHAGGPIVVDKDDPTGEVITLGVQYPDQLLVSFDGGRSVTPASLPDPHVFTVALVGPADRLVVWVVTFAVDGDWSIHWRQLDDESWHLLAVPFHTTGSLDVLPIDQHRVIAVDSSMPGFLCTTDLGHTWSHRCPAV